MKLVVNIETINRQNNPTLFRMEKLVFVHDKSWNWNIKKKNSIKITTSEKFNGVDFLKTLVIIRIFYTFVTVNIILV